MPLGVEHSIASKLSRWGPVVSQPLMPLGVEHARLRARLASAARESTFDAVRR